MTVYRFTGPMTSRRHSGKCPRCGKRTTRSRTFEMTVNPFNRNKETGKMKTRDEVRADLDAKADAWVPDFRHGACVFADKVDIMSTKEVTEGLREARRNLEVEIAHPGRACANALELRSDIAVYEARLAVLNSTLTTETP